MNCSVDVALGLRCLRVLKRQKGESVLCSVFAFLEVEYFACCSCRAVIRVDGGGFEVVVILRMAEEDRFVLGSLGLWKKNLKERRNDIFSGGQISLSESRAHQLTVTSEFTE